jgi:hypothetical protein
MNIGQKMAFAVGGVLIGIRAAYPVKYSGIGSLRFDGGPEFLQQVDWRMTWMHIAGIAAVTIALFFILKANKNS